MFFICQRVSISVNSAFSLFFPYLCGPFVFISFCFCSPSSPLNLFLYVCLSLLCCSVTRSRSSLFLVYVLPFFHFLCMQAEWAGAGTYCLCGLQHCSESFSSAYHAVVHLQPVALAVWKVCMHLGVEMMPLCLICMSDTWWFVCFQKYKDINCLTS